MGDEGLVVEGNAESAELALEAIAKLLEAAGGLKDVDPEDARGAGMAEGTDAAEQ
jgi:hypothetical protein